MTTATKSNTLILSVLVERVKSTSDAFSVYTAYSEESSWETKTYKQFTGPVVRGQRWVVAGQWMKDDKWGNQFHAVFATPAVPSNKDELECLLSGDLLPGWKLRDLFSIEGCLGKAEAWRAIITAPHTLDVVPGISQPMIATLTDAWGRARNTARVYADLAELGVGGRLADKLVAYYGAAALERLTADPYKDVLNIDGYGWRNADSIGNRLGILAEDPRRLTAGLAYALHEDTWKSGSTWQTFSETAAGASTLLGCAYDAAKQQIGAALLERHIVAREDRLYPRPLDRAEERIAGAIAARLLSSPALTPADHALLPVDQSISTDQAVAVEMACDSTLALLTGGPGVGKTTTLRVLVAACNAMGWPITCMAPTGRAAARMAEATDWPASTIHSRLKITPGALEAGEDAELLTGMVIVDEVSMLDTQLAAALLSRVSPSAHLLLVGDPDQLPSVGPGAVLRDLICAGAIPRVHLDKVYRNDAGIAVNAARIRAGQDLLEMEDVQLWEAVSPEHAASLIVSLVGQSLREGIDQNDLLILTPQNDGPSGRHSLNALLQPLLNDAEPGSGITKSAGTVSDGLGGRSKKSEEIRVGDRIMVTKNSKTLDVFNGQTGIVTSVTIPRSITAVVDGTEICFSGEDKALVTLAYAITGHKSQGSEAKIIISPIFPSRVLSREWLYTVLTRGRERVYLIGDEYAMQHCLTIQSSQARRTGLMERLQTAVEA